MVFVLFYQEEVYDVDQKIEEYQDKDETGIVSVTDLFRLHKDSRQINKAAIEKIGRIEQEGLFFLIEKVDAQGEHQEGQNEVVAGACIECTDREEEKQQDDGDSVHLTMPSAVPLPDQKEIQKRDQEGDTRQPGGMERMVQKKIEGIGGNQEEGEYGTDGHDADNRLFPPGSNQPVPAGFPIEVTGGDQILQNLVEVLGVHSTKSL